MSFNNLLHRIFDLSFLESNPPVLVDIGASEAMHKLWKKISRFSICIAFDADNRDMGYVEKISDKYRKLYVFNSIVTDEMKTETDFYLTSSPYCSSTLEPNMDELQKWAYSEKFEVINRIKINSSRLIDSLKELKIDKIDWYKSDSQGIDLRLFNSLPQEINKKIIVVEFEPGFINSYKGEDKLSDLIKSFESKDFWLSDIKVKGSQRINKSQLNKYFKLSISKKLAQFSIKTSPGWAEIIYINNYNNDNFSPRELFLGWIFSSVLNQHGFALLLVEKMLNENPSNMKIVSLLKDMRNYSIRRIRRNIMFLKFAPIIIIKLKQLTGLQ